MACCLCFFWTSKSLIPLLIVIFAVFTSFSMSLSALLIMFSTLVFIKFSEQKLINSNEESQQEAEAASRTCHWSLPQEKQAPALDELKTMFISSKVGNESEMLMGGPKEEQNRNGSFIIRSQDLEYSGYDSMDEHSSSDSGHEDDHSDIEWLHDMEQKQAEYFLDGSISDEESLIEIVIPSGQFVSLQEEDPKLNLNCKLSAKERSQELDDIGELAGDQEDNLIEIDIYMGSIKYSKHYGAKDIHTSLYL